MRRLAPDAIRAAASSSFTLVLEESSTAMLAAFAFAVCKAPAMTPPSSSTSLAPKDSAEPRPAIKMRSKPPPGARQSRTESRFPSNFEAFIALVSWPLQRLLAIAPRGSSFPSSSARTTRTPDLGRAALEKLIFMIYSIDLLAQLLSCFGGAVQLQDF